MLKEIKEKSPIPVITNVKEGYDGLDNEGKRIFDIEILASRLWSLGSDDKIQIKNDFNQGLIKV